MPPIKYWVAYTASIKMHPKAEPHTFVSGMPVMMTQPIVDFPDIIGNVQPAIARQIILDRKLPTESEITVNVLSWQRFESIIQLQSPLGVAH